MALSTSEKDDYIVSFNIIPNISTQEYEENVFLPATEELLSSPTSNILMSFGKQRFISSKDNIGNEERPRLLSVSRMERVAKKDASHSDIINNDTEASDQK